LTVRGSTVQFNDGSSQFNIADAVVLLGSATIVTAENNTTLKGLDYKSISVGQHIIARGIYSLPASGVVTLDATGSTSTNTGSVRMQSTQLWGPLVSSTSGTVTIDLQTINNWPASVYTFTGNGVSAVVPASYEVNKGTAALPAGAVDGDQLWIDGVTTALGSAPPDFNAFTINTEVSVPARLQVDWTSTGTITPFTTLTGTGLTIDLGDPHFSAGVIRIGSESIALKSLAETPQIVPQATPAATAGLPAVFLPMFSIGNLSAADTITIAEFNAFTDFVAQLPKSIVAATPALRLVATGTYNRGSNTFTASSIDVVN
jgi:hypothetical protein